MKKNNGIKIFTGIVVSLVLIVMIISFFLIGSPANQRLLRLDEQRSSNLQSLENFLLSHWRLAADLPEDITEVADEAYEKEALYDPETNTQYIYRRVHQDQFELCATFAFAKENDREYLNNKYDYLERSQSYYTHSAGEQCYEITLNRDSYEKTQNRNDLEPLLPTTVY